MSPGLSPEPEKPPVRKVVRWDRYDPPPEWSGLLECGHEFGKRDGDELSDKGKAECEREGVACYDCLQIEQEIADLEERLRQAKAKRPEVRGDRYFRYVTTPVLPVNEEDQALVDRLVKENAPSLDSDADKKRLLSQEAAAEPALENDGTAPDPSDLPKFTWTSFDDADNIPRFLDTAWRGGYATGVKRARERFDEGRAEREALRTIADELGFRPEVPPHRIAEDAIRRINDRHSVSVYPIHMGRVREWIASPNGALCLGERLTFEAVQGGGILVITHPFRMRKAPGT